MPAKKMSEEQPRVIDSSKIPRDNPEDLLGMFEANVGGEGVIIQRGQEVEGRMDLRRPSGIISLDVACSGGLPAGGLSQIDGSDGVGKNLLLNHYFARCQKTYGEECNILMVCFEALYDKVFGRKCGVRVALSPYEIDVEQRKRKAKGKPLMTEKEIETARTDQVGKFHIIRGNVAEKMLQVVADAVAANTYQIIGVDSWDAMLPDAENKKELEDNAKVAGASGVQTRWMSKVFGALTPQKICPECFDRPLGFKNAGEGRYNYICPNKSCGWKGKKPYMWENETTIIGIRQVRANLNKMGMHSRDTKVGGSHALRHGKMIDIELRRGESIMKSNHKIGKEVNWEITKGKAGTHEGIKGVFSYFYDPPKIAVVDDLVHLALAKEVICGGGKGGYVFDGHKLGKQDDLVAAIENDGKLRAAVRKAVLGKLDLGHIRYK